MIERTFRGYMVSAEHKPHNKYVKSIYRGKVTWTLDYTYAAHYSEKVAKKHDNNIKNGIYR